MKNIPIRNIDATQAEANLAEGFSIQHISALPTLRNALEQSIHRHDFFYLLALEQASGTHEIDFVPYEVSHHSLAFMRPGQVHQHALNTQGSGYLLAFTPAFYHPANPALHQLLRKASSINFYHFSPEAFAKLLKMMDAMQLEYRDKRLGYQEVIKAHLSIFFTELVRQSNQPTQAGSLYQQERLDEFLLLVENQLTTQKSPAQYAQQMNLSVYQLNAITKATLGKTSSSIINDYVVLEAKRHLLATSLRVNQIAYQLGYEDVSYFIRFFRKHMGCSPQAFRENSQ